MKKLLLLAILLISAVTASADSISYIPHIHGVLRTRWEMETESGKSHFQVRHARLNVEGNIAPFIDYYLHADFCDKGSFKFLDAYARVKPFKGFAFQVGQFRAPFGVETFRSPTNYYFANRAFMQKEMCNYRRVGAKVQYLVPTKAPLLLEAGAFNNASISDHTKWSTSYCFAGKATLTLGQFKLTGGAMGVKPGTERLYMYDAALQWQNKHFYVAAEYMNQHYGHNVYKDAHSYVAMIDYHHGMNKKFFNQWSVQGRFDGITKHWDGTSADLLPARNRITLGGTLTYKWKALFADIRLNYEKYFYQDGVTAPEGLGDKVVAELVVRF